MAKISKKKGLTKGVKPSIIQTVLLVKMSFQCATASKAEKKGKVPKASEEVEHLAG